ncbi:hypothetical protein JTE90_002398 [Oedothorax gibbosus]|uniref:Uncharacterized protein n=1 Tax=Oedothorax gibbosus TaxID=931172 RepID=A0AAV6TI48_9ARAC|nr:hypothetical protein JTE90_002398 [Oedothorax gibbosus]
MVRNGDGEIRFDSGREPEKRYHIQRNRRGLRIGDARGEIPWNRRKTNYCEAFAQNVSIIKNKVRGSKAIRISSPSSNHNRCPASDPAVFPQMTRRASFREIQSFWFREVWFCKVKLKG